MNKPSLTNIIVAVLAAAGFLAIYLGLSKPVLTIPMMEGNTMVKDANETLLPFVKGSALAGIALSRLGRAAHSPPCHAQRRPYRWLDASCGH